jgi:hypothetical protein
MKNLFCNEKKKNFYKKKYGLRLELGLKFEN